jgi:hypothetical protein
LFPNLLKNHNILNKYYNANNINATYNKVINAKTSNDLSYDKNITEIITQDSDIKINQLNNCIECNNIS